jgi:hypothetical protein
MKKQLLLLLALPAITIWCPAQADLKVLQQRQSTEVVQALAATINADDLQRHLTILAGDAFEGRETGAEGQRKAAQYIASVFESYGLPKIGNDNSYFQKISFISENWDRINLAVNDEKPRHLWDFYALPNLNGDLDAYKTDEVVFLGYGIEDKHYSDYEGADVKGKVILVYGGEPFGADSLSMATGGRGVSKWSTDIRHKLSLAKAKGAKAVLIIDTDFKDNLAEARKAITSTSLQIGQSENAGDKYANNLFITSDLARQIVGDRFKEVVKARKRIQKKGKSKSITLPCSLEITQRKRVRTLEGENVLGFVEGGDLKNEIIVVSAHYDHLGKRGDDVYNGADDNGSGTSTVLDIAQAFAAAKKDGLGPRRSVLFLLVSGEEKGLLGSQYYVNNPVFPLENTVVNINVDMVGRTDEKHKDDPNYIYVIGADRLSTELHKINEAANEKYTKLALDYTYNAESDPNRFYYRSDHYNFAERGIPAVFYFSGVHEDYHRTTDDVDKIMFDKMTTIARLIFHTSWELANRDKRIEVDVKP